MAVNNEVNITLNAKDKASAELKNVEKSANGLGSKLSALGGPLKAIGAGLAVAGTAAGVVGVKMFQMGADMEQSLGKAKTVFGEYYGEMQKFADENASAMGLTRNEYLKTAAGMQDLLIPMGFTRQEATKLTQETTSLAGALAEWSAGQYDAAQVGDILTAAMLGERDQLKSLGIAISEEDVQQRLLVNGTNKLTGAALQQAKALATQQLIFEKSTDAQAAYANGADTLTRKKNEMIATLGNLQSTIVSALIPAFGEIVTTIKPVIEKVAENISLWFQNKENIAALTGTIKTLISVFGTVFSVLGTAISWIYQFGEGLGFAAFKVTELAGIIPTKMIEIKDSIINNLISARDSLIGIFEAIKSTIGNAFDSIMTKFQEFWNKFGTGIEVIGATITGLYLPKILMMSAVTIAEFAKITASWIAIQAQSIASSTIIAIQSIPRIIASLGSLIISMTGTVIKTGVSWATIAIQSVTTAATTGVSAAKIVASWVLIGVQSAIQAAKVAASWLIAFGPIGWAVAAIGGLGVIVVKNWDLISAKTTELGISMSNTWAGIKNSAYAAFEDMKNGIISKFQAAIDFVQGALAKVKAVWDKVSGIVSSVKNAASNVASGVGNFISGTKANGGDVKAGKAYKVGERGSELFVPSTNGTIVPNSGIGGNISINMGGVTVNNEADENRLVQKIQANLTETLQMYKFGIS